MRRYIASYPLGHHRLTVPLISCTHVDTQYATGHIQTFKKLTSNDKKVVLVDFYAEYARPLRPHYYRVHIAD